MLLNQHSGPLSVEYALKKQFAVTILLLHLSSKLHLNFKQNTYTTHIIVISAFVPDYVQRQRSGARGPLKKYSEIWGFGESGDRPSQPLNSPLLCYFY